MAAKKYVELNASGTLQEVAATVTSAGAGDDGKIPALDATGRLDTSTMPVGIGADTNAITASEALSAGDLVNAWDNGGTPKIRKADASADKPADGFVLAAVLSGASATVYSEGSNTQVTSLTGGTEYFLSETTPGGVQSTPPTGSGALVQKIGKAFSATVINFQKGNVTKRA